MEVRVILRENVGFYGRDQVLQIWFWKSGVQPSDSIPYRTCAWANDLGPEIRVYRACYAHCITPLVDNTKMSRAVICRIKSITFIMSVCVCMCVCAHVCVCVCVCERLCTRKRG